jgi:hypothetical protein
MKFYHMTLTCQENWKVASGLIDKKVIDKAGQPCRRQIFLLISSLP